MNQGFGNLAEEKRNRILEVGILEFSKKSYLEVTTDKLVHECKISKGLLFYYFGSKKQYYEYCLENALEKTFEDSFNAEGKTFYEIIFAAMDVKIKNLLNCPAEMKLINMASKETAKEVMDIKEKIFSKFMNEKKAESITILKKAIEKLPIKDKNNEQILPAMLLYTQAIMQKYLLFYQDNPEKFLENQMFIKEEIKKHINFMLYGIAKEDLQ